MAEKLGQDNVPSRVHFSYTPTDSSEGEYCVATGDCHFAGTDSVINAALTPEHMRLMPNAWLLPSLAMAIAIGFNLPSFGDLELRIPREALAEIFLGRIRQWSELAEWNPKLAGVEQNISLVVRSDSSAVSKAFSSALSSFSAEWNGKVGSSSRPNWPRFDLHSGDEDGVAMELKQRPYSLGFISQPGAVKFYVSMALISNDVGSFVAPSTSGVQSAMDAFAVELDERGRNGERLLFQSIVDPKNQPGAYPISMFTYLMFDAGKLDCSKLYDVMFLVYWGWTDPRAAAIARAHSLSGISAAVRGALVVGLRNISCNGSNLLEEVAYDYEPSIVGTGAAIPYVHASLSPIIDTKARFIWPCACHLAASRSTVHTNTHRVSSRS